MAYIGNQTVGTGVILGANGKYCTRYQAGSSFNVDTMYIYSYDEWISGEYVRLGIYSDTSGDPDALLGFTLPIEGDGAENWKSSVLNTEISIVSGSYYHLAILTSAELGVYQASGSGDSHSNSDTYSDGFTDPFGSPVTQTILLNIYAESVDETLSKGGSVIEASDGTKISVTTDGNSIKIWKDIDGTKSLVDYSTAATIHGGGAIGWIDAAIDSNDDIHVISSCTSEQTRDVAYAVYDLTTGFGTWEEAADYTEAAPTNPGCAISIDSNDYPHILFVDRVKMTGSTQDNVYYDYNDGSWNGAEQVGVRATKTDVYSQPKITLAPADDVEVVYFSVIGGTPGLTY